MSETIKVTEENLKWGVQETLRDFIAWLQKKNYAVVFYSDNVIEEYVEEQFNG